MTDSTTAPSAAPTAAVRLRGIRHQWPGATDALLNIPSFELAAGERVLLSGPSGSGKSTLLNIIGAVQPPTAGTVEVAGTDITALPAGQRDRFRGDHIGFIFQAFNLLPYLSVDENVRLPLRFSRRRRLTGTPQVDTVLTALGLTGDLRRRPASQLSVGQQQRVAAARALLGNPTLIVADEPTSALDADNASDFLELLFAACANRQISLLMVSHDLGLAPRFDRALTLVELSQC